MSELEQRLTQLGRELDWPETPDLAPAVRQRLAAPAPAPARRRRVARLPQVPGHRARLAACARRWAFRRSAGRARRGARVLRAPGCDGGEAAPAIPDAPELRLLQLGQRTTLERRPRRARLHAARPARRGRARGVFVGTRTPGGELSLTYRPGAGMPATGNAGLGLLVGEFRGDLAPEYHGKIAGETTRIERLRVDGDRAIWIEGAPHLFFYRPPDSDFAESDLRLAHNVLLLERGNLLVRLEGSSPRTRRRAGRLTGYARRPRLRR